jgi:formate dehydrogenase major subunit
VPGLGTSFGRGGATTAQQDLANADAILIMGSSMAENHPVGFQWVVEARERGATVIHVDPRFTRTSAMADLWVPLRAGSDIVLLGALVRHVLEERRYFHDYVVRYTNAATLLREDLAGPEELDGLFSGWDPGSASYDPETWLYEAAGGEARGVGPMPGHEPEAGGHEKDRGGEAQSVAPATRDETLTHPRCVFQVLRRHFARYTPDMVERACGVPADQFRRVAEAFCSASGPERTAAICYAVGWTQHSTGVQIIRTAAILQLLLGNVGRPGGGILALRGHASIQGSTDVPTLYDILPGYLPMPHARPEDETLAGYLRRNGAERGWWHNLDRYMVSLLRAWYGDAAGPEQQWGYPLLPRVDGDHSHQGYWLEMAAGKLEGLFVFGQNPAVGAPNAALERRALGRLQWLVVRDLVETEVASFWYDSPEVASGELEPGALATEVFLLPAAGHAEKDGTFTNTQRLLQWHEKAVEPPGDCRSEAWFVVELGRRLKTRAASSRRRRDRALRALVWDYPAEGPRGEPVVEAVSRELNGWTVASAEGPEADPWARRRQVAGFTELQADGSTACGCWIYSGSFPAADENRARRRRASGALGHGWGFAWPSDRRILYNRASARPDGRPWSERKKLVWWDEAAQQWTGLDVPDFARTKRPDYEPPPGARGDAALAGDRPFTMHPDGVGWLWVASGLKDGPLPTHYEPLESPIDNPLYGQQRNPAALPLEGPGNAYTAGVGDPRFPHVLTTYRITEHHAAGGMTRTLPHLAELQPELFCELSPELAAEAGIEHGGWVTVSSPRGAIEARALVTSRMRPLRVDGRTVHQVGLPFHWGPRGLARGDVVNDLVAMSQEPNVRIMEAKALVCQVAPGRRPRGSAARRDLDARA